MHISLESGPGGSIRVANQLCITPPRANAPPRRTPTPCGYTFANRAQAFASARFGNTRRCDAAHLRYISYFSLSFSTPQARS